MRHAFSTYVQITAAWETISAMEGEVWTQRALGRKHQTLHLSWNSELSHVWSLYISRVLLVTIDKENLNMKFLYFEEAANNESIAQLPAWKTKQETFVVKWFHRTMKNEPTVWIKKENFVSN